MFVSASSNNGVTFGTPVSISGNTHADNTFQRMYASGSDVYVTWENGTNTGGWWILFRASTDKGATWGPLQVLSGFINATTCPVLCAQPTLTTNGSYVYVTWTDQNKFGGEDTFFVASNNYGAQGSFGTVMDLGHYDSGSSHEQEIAAWGSNIYISYDDVGQFSGSFLETAYVLVSNNNGATWTTTRAQQRGCGQPEPRDSR